MTKLDCNVTGCLHNSENCCCKNVIVVEGQTARESVTHAAAAMMKTRAACSAICSKPLRTDWK